MKRIFNRLAQMFITLIGVSFITFCLAYIAPGDPVAMLLESADTIVSEEVLQKTREELGLDKPFLVQYGNWAAGLLHGDMGMSYSAKKPVVEKLSEGFVGTILLALVTVELAIGNQPSLSPKMYSKINPSQKLGIDTPINEKNLTR